MTKNDYIFELEQILKQRGKEHSREVIQKQIDSDYKLFLPYIQKNNLQKLADLIIERGARLGGNLNIID